MRISVQKETKMTVSKTLVAAAAMLALSAGAALAAEGKCCCENKPGEAMACCDKGAAGPAAPSGPQTPPTPPTHQH